MNTSLLTDTLFVQAHIANTLLNMGSLYYYDFENYATDFQGGTPEDFRAAAELVSDKLFPTPVVLEPGGSPFGAKEFEADLYKMRTLAQDRLYEVTESFTRRMTRAFLEARNIERFERELLMAHLINGLMMDGFKYQFVIHEEDGDIYDFHDAAYEVSFFFYPHDEQDSERKAYCEEIDKRRDCRFYYIAEIEAEALGMDLIDYIESGASCAESPSS